MVLHLNLLFYLNRIDSNSIDESMPEDFVLVSPEIIDYMMFNTIQCEF